VTEDDDDVAAAADDDVAFLKQMKLEYL